MIAKNCNDNILQSVDNALRLFELFKENEELGVTQVANELAIAKSTAFRLLNTLRARKYVVKNLDTDQYRLGYRFATWGDIVRNRNEIVRLSQPYLINLTRLTKEISFLSVLEDDYNVRFINKILPSTGSNIYCSPVGNKIPSYGTASGRVMLAHLPTPRIEEYLTIVELNVFTPKTITDKDVLRKELIKIKQTGYCVDDEESEHGLTCFATPIMNSIGDVIAAISISGPTGRITLEKDEKIEQLKMTAEKIMNEINA